MILKRVKRYLVFALGMCILAFGMYNIHSRSGVSEGGSLGLSLLVHQWTGFSPGIFSFILDMTCFLIGTIVMGKGFLGDSIIASAMYSCWYQVFAHIGPIVPDLSGMPYLAALFGGICVGVGCGMVVHYDVASGGDDAMAIVIHKLTGLKVSRFYVLSDVTILLLSLSYIPLKRICWSLVTVLISSALIELLRPKDKQEAAETDCTA